MHYLDDLGIDQLGATYGVHRATAARRINAARKALLDATRQELARQLRVGEATVDGIIRLVRSQFHDACMSYCDERPSGQGVGRALNHARTSLAPLSL